jgi:hypothetical protein
METNSAKSLESHGAFNVVQGLVLTFLVDLQHVFFELAKNMTLACKWLNVTSSHHRVELLYISA